MLHITGLKVVAPYQLWLRFTDGVEGVADLADALDGEVFTPLQDPVVFASATLDPELQTVVWPNGADLAPEYLRARLHQAVV